MRELLEKLGIDDLLQGEELIVALEKEKQKYLRRLNNVIGNQIQEHRTLSILEKIEEAQKALANSSAGDISNYNPTDLNTGLMADKMMSIDDVSFSQNLPSQSDAKYNAEVKAPSDTSDLYRDILKKAKSIVSKKPLTPTDIVFSNFKEGNIDQQNEKIERVTHAIVFGADNNYSQTNLAMWMLLTSIFQVLWLDAPEDEQNLFMVKEMLDSGVDGIISWEVEWRTDLDRFFELLEDSNPDNIALKSYVNYLKLAKHNEDNVVKAAQELFYYIGKLDNLFQNVPREKLDEASKNLAELICATYSHKHNLDSDVIENYINELYLIIKGIATNKGSAPFNVFELLKAVKEWKCNPPIPNFNLYVETYIDLVIDFSTEFQSNPEIFHKYIEAGMPISGLTKEQLQMCFDNFKVAHGYQTTEQVPAKAEIPGATKKSVGTVKSVSIGELVLFGGYDWRVLDVQDGKALLLSEKVIEEHPYNVDYESITWEFCSLRKYLNIEFYNELCDAKKDIIEICNSNSNNPWFGTNGGNKTFDKVFILSLDEVVKYFGDSGDLINRKDWLYKNDKPVLANGEGVFVHDRYDGARIAFDGNKEPVWWWLRSSGDADDKAAFVFDDGSIRVSGEFVDDEQVGVRPALWVDLHSKEIEQNQKGVSSGAVTKDEVTTSGQNSVNQIIQEANAGNPESQYILGNYYYNGEQGLSKNDAEALRWWHMAADQGLVQAQYSVRLKSKAEIFEELSQNISGRIKKKFPEGHLLYTFLEGDVMKQFSKASKYYITSENKKSISLFFAWLADGQDNSELKADEFPILLHDSTLKQNGKKGFVITNKAIYTSMKGKHIKLEDVSKIRDENYKVILNDTIILETLGDRKEIRIFLSEVIPYIAKYQAKQDALLTNKSGGN